ncbi:MAG: hypothetical protein F6K55_26510 [Moorea sp. SIO4A3]|nr:hypothetical protein [Moorena sp. SIO4A3]
MLKLTRSLLAQIAGIFDNYRPLLNQRAIDMQSRYAPEAFGQRPPLRERKAWPLASASALMRSRIAGNSDSK